MLTMETQIRRRIFQTPQHAASDQDTLFALTTGIALKHSQDKNQTPLM